MTVKKLISTFLGFFFILNIIACGGGGSAETATGALSTDTATGTLSLGLTDAPIVDENNVTGVFITVTAVQYHGNGGWHTLKDFNTSINPINLMDLQDGVSLNLASTELPAGKYTQVRFMLDAAEENKGTNKSNTGCFIQFDGDRNETLYVPSGSTSGYKAIGNFEVTANSNVSITADFDIRKSVTQTGSGYYKLKPTIRLVVDSHVGEIKGDVSNLIPPIHTYVIYAYKADVDVVYEASQDFANAISSTIIKADGSYTLAFLPEGNYDLITAEYGLDGVYIGTNVQIDISITSTQTTHHDFFF